MFLIEFINLIIFVQELFRVRFHFSSYMIRFWGRTVKTQSYFNFRVTQKKQDDEKKG